jgi:hypothetical protein
MFTNAIKIRIMRKIIVLFTTICLTYTVLNGQTAQKMDEPIGKWRFETPYASEGYQRGLIEIRKSAEIYSAAISFADTVYKLYASNVKYNAGLVDFIINIEGQPINISLSFTHPDTLKGRAFTPDGELPMTLMRKKD